jgi:putative hydrolase of the HAD superfamily
MADPAAIFFDLDDTLYPEGTFARGGFKAVAAHVSRAHGIRRGELMNVLFREWRAGRRATAFQCVCTQFGLDPAIVPVLVGVYRSHQPQLQLSTAARQTLERLRHKWRLGVITNGDPEVQRRKVSALGLHSLVDDVVFAAEYGSGRGKPDPEPFAAATDRLGVGCDRAMFVGDDIERDVYGARRAGMLTIRLAAGSRWLAPVSARREADMVVSRIQDVPAAVAVLWRLRDRLVTRWDARCA